MPNISINDMADRYKSALETAFPDYEVDDYPDDARNYQLAHPMGAVLIVFQDRKFEPAQSTVGVGQGNEPVFNIVYVSRSLRNANRDSNIYDMLDTGRAALKGLEFERGYAEIDREFFIELGPGGIWKFGQNWKHYDYFD
jgi:hypothetical protein